MSFLLACAAVFVFAAGINYMFPYFSRAVGDKVSSVVDYRSAFAVIGEGISGGKKLGEALTEAWAEAFNKKDDDVPVMTGSFEPESENSELPPAVTGSPDGTNGGVSAELTNALLEAFAESQREYADYMTPAGMDYTLI